MEKYLQQILKEVNTIIIPGLGALTITNDKTGEVMYMSYLKYDDGKLSAYISEKGNIDNDEAKSQISSYVENILNRLEKLVETIDVESLPSTRSSYNTVSYDVVRQRRSKRLGAAFINVSKRI